MNINETSYSRICESWHQYRRKSPVNRCVTDFAGYLKPHARILDIGCGTGYPIAAYLSGQGFRVHGIDISQPMIEKARALRLPEATFSVQDILEYNTPDKYDGVVAFDSLWHIAHDRQAEIYPIISSLTNPGGYFLFTHGKSDGSVSGEMFGERFEYSALDVQAVHALLRNNGFEILSSMENYVEETTGDRDLMILARKINSDATRHVTFP